VAFFHKLQLMKRWRLYAVLVLGSALPLLLFLYAADRSLRSATIKSLLQQAGPAADLAANAMEERLARGKTALQSLAADPALVQAWTHGDINLLANQLQIARELNPQIASLTIYDANGYPRASSPKIISQSQNSAASFLWFKAVMESKTAYVSGASTSEAKDNTAVVIMAVPMDQKPSAVLAATYTTDTIKSWTHSIAPSTMKWISVVDQNGTVLAGADLGNSGSLSQNTHPGLKQVLAGQSGTQFIWQGGKRVLVSRHPIRSLHWGVLVEIPASEIDSAIWQFERPMAFIAILFIGLALAIGIVIASLYRRLREGEAHIRQIITTATDAFIAIDARGTITDWNPKAEEIFGWSHAEAVGQPLHTTIIPPQYRESHLRGMKHFMATGKGPVLDKRLELSALHRNGSEFPVELSISRAQRDGKNYFNGFLHDISRRRRAQEEISNLNAELHFRVSELEERNKALEAFSYSVSHDVRAPLRNIAGFAELLQEEFARQLTPASADYLDRIRKNVARMQRLVNDLLRFARLGEMGLDLQTTDLHKLVLEVIASFERELSGRQVTFDVSPISTIECDRGLITQVFSNLVGNAIKFTGSRQIANISIGDSIQDGERIFFVRDNGVGFDMKHAGKLFGPFQRLHRNDEFEGTGVGLATAQRIIVKHQGRIWAQSEIGHGATFFFSLEPQKSNEMNSATAHV
jgi:PAS domain S-box-containing protein